VEAGNIADSRAVLEADGTIADQGGSFGVLPRLNARSVTAGTLDHLLENRMRLGCACTAEGSTEDAALPVRTGVGKGIGGIVPGGAPEYLSIRRHDVEQVDALVDGEGGIKAAREVVIGRGQAHNDLGSRRTDAVNS